MPPRIARDEALRLVEIAVRRSGDERAVEALKALEEDLASRAATVADITQALLRSEQTYRLVFSHEHDPVSLFDPATGRFLDVNQAWLDLYGYARDEVAGLRVADVSAEPAATSDAIARASKEGGARIFQRLHKKKDGTRFPVELTCGKLELGGREVMYSAMRDISARVDAEEALARSEASFRALIEGMLDGVIVHRDGKIVYMNPSGRKLLGYSADEDVAGRPVIDLIHSDDRPLVAERLRRLLAEGADLPLVEERLVGRDGKTIVLEVSAIQTILDGHLSVIAIGRDVSARKRMEAQLLMADRLASIGRLAASVGHEINNPLAYVLGNVSLMERELAAAPDLPADIVMRLRERLDIVREGSERMRDIVRELKTLARSDDDVKGSIDVARVLDVCADMALHEIRHRARLVKDYAPGLFALATEARLGQVFLNLLVNAGQAIPEGDAGGNEVRITARALADMRISVEVRDSGVGIPPEDRERIFEPFFTTKGPGAGSGLGLSICHHIVTSLGGTIDMVPVPSGGTVFRVVLPAAEAPHLGDADLEPPRASGGHRVLVADDEVALADICAAELEGYDVVVAHSGREAIALLARGERFDAIVCDLLMNDRTGADVYEFLRAERPGLERRIVFMTGGASTPSAQDLLASVDNERLEKPFSGAALREAVGRVIAGR